MGIQVAVVKRLSELIDKYEWTLYELAYYSGVPYSTIKAVMSGKVHSIKINTLKKIVDAFDITIGEFFNVPIFNNLNQEIQ